MRLLTRCVSILTVGALLSTGCSRSNVDDMADATGIEPLGTASIAPTPDLAPSGNALKPTSTEPTGADEIEPFRNPFEPPTTPPKPVIREKPKPKPKPVEARPAVRLLGFMNVDEPKAMLSIHGEPLIVSVGDKITNWTVESVEAPALVMTSDEEEMRLELFEQEWQHAAAKLRSASGFRARSTSRPNANRPRTNSYASGNSRPSASTSRPPTASGSQGLPRLPGLAPSSGSDRGPLPEIESDRELPDGGPPLDTPPLPSLPELPGG